MAKKSKQKYFTAGATVLAALATAHLMQRGSGFDPDRSPQISTAPLDTASATAPIPGSRAIARPQPVSVLVSVPAADRARTAPQDDETAVADTNRPNGPTASPAPLVAEPADLPPPRRLSAADTPAADPGYELPDSVSLRISDIGPAHLADVTRMPRPPEEVLTPARLPGTGADLQARMAAVIAANPDPGSEIDDAPAAPAPARNQYGLPCGTILTASPADAAMVNVTLTNPCRTEEAVTVSHGDLAYTAQTDEFGVLKQIVPALAAEATVEIRFEDGESASADVTVPDFAEVDRVVLQSDARSGLQIHALEFGATYGEDGHVWRGAPRSPEAAALAGGGFVTVLGDPDLTDARTAEVYTFPADTRNRDGVVRLSIEAEVTEFNCDQEVSGQTLQPDADGAMTPVTLTLAMPDCAAVGEYLVLKNLLRDLKIASN